MDKFKKIRLITIVCLIIIIPLGLLTKAYSGFGQDWINNSSSGIFYEVFWCLLILLIVPKLQPGNISFGVLFFTCILEFMQLWHPPLLQSLRSTWLGATILGTSFVVSDFIYYIIGAILGWLVLLAIKQVGIKKEVIHKRNQTN
jgi:Protein of unknown function (DUF2809)